MQFDIKTAMNKLNSYDENQFQDDIQELIHVYEDLNPIDIVRIREEINNWNFEVPKEMIMDLEEVLQLYTHFIEYNNRITFLIDNVNMHNEMISFIIKSGKDLACQYLDGTKVSKDSKANVIFLSLMKEETQIKSLLSFLEKTNKSIEFACAQLARMLREKEALTKINQGDYNRGSALKYQQNQNIEVKTKNTLR